MDDHLELAQNIGEILEIEGYECLLAQSAEQALEIVEERDVSAIITDFRLPGDSGAELITTLRRQGRGIPAVVMSAYSDAETVHTVERAGARDFLAKPVDVARLTAVLRTLCRNDADEQTDP